MTHSPLTYSHVFMSDGLPASECGKRYRKRQEAFLDALESPAILTSVLSSPTQGEPWAILHTTLYQEPLLHHLTGLNQYPAALILDPKRRLSTLYLPKKNPLMEFWEGFSFGLGDELDEATLRELCGVDALKPLESLITDYLALAKRHKTLNLFWYPPTRGKKAMKGSLDQFKKQVSYQLKRAGLSTSIHSIADLVWQLRLPLDATDLTTLKEANTLTTEVFKTLCQSLSTDKTEQDVYARLQYEILKRSRFGESFSAIVAGGANAAVLHYTKNDAPLNPGDMILLDFGVRCHSMPADVSRTIPVSGRYNPLQKVLYNLVLGVQASVESRVKSGVTIDELNTHCWEKLNSDMEMFLKNHHGTWEKPYGIQPHNVGHLLGLMVHDGDPYRRYKNQPLQEGVVITNEPGLYGTVTAIIDGASYTETLGIRIEDNLLVTATGCENLTAMCPKSIEDIEGLFK